MHQHDLPALDDFLDLVLSAIARRAIGNFLQRVGAADRFDHFFGRLFFLAIGIKPARLCGNRAFAALGSGECGLGKLVRCAFGGGASRLTREPGLNLVGRGLARDFH